MNKKGFTIMGLLLTMVVSTAANGNIQLNERVTNQIFMRQNIIYKIQSCNDVEIEISSKGKMVIEAGPARGRSIKGFQEDIKKEINNSTLIIDISFPFVHYNTQNKICLIYLSLYGQINQDVNSTKECEFTFVARPKVINEIQIVPIQNISESVPIIYANSLHSSQDMIYLLEGEILKGNSLKVFIFEEFPLSLSSPNGTISYQNNNIEQFSLPNLIFSEEGKAIASKKKKKNSKNASSSNQNYKKSDQQAKNSFLNLNLQQNVIINEEKLMFLIENNNKSLNSLFQITQSSISQFSPLSNLSNLQFSGLNFLLKKGKRQQVLLNNQGTLILEVYSTKMNKLSIYSNPPNPNQMSSALSGKQELKSINDYTSYILLPNASLEDYIILVSEQEDNVDVLLEIKQYSASTLSQMTSKRSEYLQFSVNDYIISLDKSDAELVYLFVSENADVSSYNSLIGESASKLVHFQAIDPLGYELHNLLSELSEYPRLYLSIRAYDKLRRAFVFESLQIDNPYSDIDYFSLNHVVLIITISGLVFAAIAFLAIKYIRKPKTVKEIDEVELIQHVQMRSDHSG